MRTFLKYFYIVAALLVLGSCELEDMNVHDSDCTIEFVARTAGYNNVNVNTKAAPEDEFETAIYTAYLLIFNGEDRVGFYELDPNSLQQRVTIKGLTTVTACIIANVQKSFAEGIKTKTALNDAVLDNISYATYSESNGHLGVPTLTVGNEKKLCFPMFGSITQDVSSSLKIQIPLVRLFAKVKMKLAMDIDAGTLQRNTYFELTSYKLLNLPTKVRLVKNNNESDWVGIRGTDNQNATSLGVKVYNADALAISDNQKVYEFDVYVPEFCLDPLPDGTANKGDEKYKPKMFATNKYPVYLQISGSYVPFSGSSTLVTYDLYLGEDEHSSFTLNRNIQYNNKLLITGIENHNGKDALTVDHRVTLSVGDIINMFGEVANCYVISQPGEYSFPAYKGAFKLDEMTPEKMCTLGTYVEDIAKDNTAVTFKTQANGKKFTLNKGLDGALVIGFEVEKMDDSNVIIALKDDKGNIEWSWHLWFVKGPTFGDINTGFFDVDVQSMPGSTKKMMDRNLGAKYSLTTNIVPGITEGLFYKYGHRNPFISGQYYGYNSANYSLWNPSKDGKSIKANTDPCPPGYRVPNSSVWSSDIATNKDASLNLSVGGIGINFEGFRHYDGGTQLNLSDITNISEQIKDDILLPYAGHLDSNNKPVDKLSDKTETKSGIVTDEEEYTTGSGWFKTTYYVRNVEWHVDINREYYGALLGADNKTFTFQVTSSSSLTPQNVVIDSFEIYALGSWWPVNLSGNISSLIKNAVNNIMGDVRADLESKLDLTQYYQDITYPDCISSCGYQVRCIKE